MGCASAKPLQLQRLAGSGAANEVRILLEQGVSPDFIDPLTDRTALHWASVGGHCQVIELLLSHGANINAVDSDGNTPLSLASQSYRVDAVIALINAGADLTRKYQSGLSIFLWELKRGHEDVCKLLVDKGVNLYEKDETGKLPLHVAAEVGFIVCCLRISG